VSPDEAEQPAKIDDTGSVEVKPFDRCSANRSEPNDARGVLTPRKVVCPSVPTGMVQGDRFAADRVSGLDMVILVVVAPLAGVSEVFKAHPTPANLGHDVLEGKGVRREVGR
jgi:hypothetical protein